MLVQHDSFRETITLAITGASGSAYGLRLMQALLAADCRVFLMVSQAGRMVLATEAKLLLPEQPLDLAASLCRHFGCDPDRLVAFELDQWTSPVASGSGAPKKMVLCPCSTGTLSAVAHGASDNLIERAADVVLKERGCLILVPREMPFSTLHLENMLSLSRMGALILPACPNFYNGPKSVDDIVNSVVGRILDHLGIEHQTTPRWGWNT